MAFYGGVMKVIICGGRSLDDYDLVKNVMNEVAARIDINEVVCGEARGADWLGKKWAAECNIPVASFYADWNRYGRAAGAIRNEEMGNYADYVIAFWDGKSTGTKHMIHYMEQNNKHGEVYLYEGKC
jgi:hypothetical protein